MGLRLDKPWLPLDQRHVDRLGGELGVYQIANSAGEVTKIGFAGGRSLFGLHSALQEELSTSGADVGRKFRVEVTQQYMSRYEELLMLHSADQGALPRDNVQTGTKLRGSLSPVPLKSA